MPPPWLNSSLSPGQASMRAAGDHAGDAQRAFQRERHDVLDERRTRHPVHEGGMLSMHEDGDVQLLGGVEEGQKLGLAQALAVDVAQQLEAVKAQGLDPLQLRGGKLHILERHRAQRVEAVRRLVHHAHQHLVQMARQVQSVPRLQPVGQQLRHGRQHLTVHRVVRRRHLPHTPRHRPATVYDRAEVPAGDHDVGGVRPGVIHGGPAVARGAVSHWREVFGNDVGMSVDDHERCSHTGFASQLRLRGIRPGRSDDEQAQETGNHERHGEDSEGNRVAARPVEEKAEERRAPGPQNCGS